MALVEGIGDEVIAFCVILFVLSLAAIVTLIGGGPSIYREEGQASSFLISQSVTSYERSETLPAATTPSLANENSERPPDIGFRESVLPRNEQNQPEPTAPSENAGSPNDASCSDEDTPIAETQLPDVPESDLPQENVAEERPLSNEIRVRIKSLDDTERVVNTDPKSTVREFKRTHFADAIAANQTVRLIFCGHLLRDESTLESYRVLDNTVLHVQILAPQSDRNQTTAQQSPNDLDIGQLMWPLFSLIVAISWVAFFRMPDIFNYLSTGLLIFFSGAFLFAYSMR